MERLKNIFYFYNINAIGGIESFFWNLSQKYKDWDIAVVYQIGDEKQLQRLRNNIRVIQYKGQQIKCERAFFNFNLDIIDQVEAEEYIQILHGDYLAMGVKPNTHPKINRYIGVSQVVCDSFEKMTGKKAELTYNPIVPRKPDKLMHLISATRLTREKGLSRIIQLAETLDKNNVKYDWTIFTDAKTPLPNPNIHYRTPRLDILDYIADADYLVQLSDNEGYCYSVIESLMAGTPVIVTDCPVFKELGVKDGKNGFVLDFDMNNIPVEKIVKGLPAFKYEPKADSWDKILAKGKSTYQEDLKKQVQIIVTKEYYDMQLDKKVEIGDVITCNKVRAEYIIENGFARMGGE
jgi:glycosyltransferase involved in cell wall biosynthesis